MCQYTLYKRVKWIYPNPGFFSPFRYERAVVAMAKQSVTLEVLSYHASASLEDAQRLRVSQVLSVVLLIN